MSDNLRRYRAIRNALQQCYPSEPTGHVARHLTTLAALISGIVASKSTQVPKVASHVPDGTKPESRVKRFARWVGNDLMTQEVYFLPYAEMLLAQLALTTTAVYLMGCSMPGIEVTVNATRDAGQHMHSAVATYVGIFRAALRYAILLWVCRPQRRRGNQVLQQTRIYGNHG